MNSNSANSTVTSIDNAGAGNVTNSSTLVSIRISAFPGSWSGLSELDQPLDFEAFLESDLLDARRRDLEVFKNVSRSSATLSMLASFFVIVWILRSNDALSTTYHRLVFGLSIGDIMSSFAMMFSSTLAPKELNYFIPGAQGNTATCTLQGFLIYTGFSSINQYNYCICLYYLAIIKYNKKEEYIRKKLEPWFHGISVVYPLLHSIIHVAMKGYNFSNITCFTIAHDPPHCIGYQSGYIPEGFTIPCGRGDGVESKILHKVLRILGFTSVFVIPPVVIFVSMWLMLRTVSKIERNMERYGVSTLRLRVARQSMALTPQLTRNVTFPRSPPASQTSTPEGCFKKIFEAFINLIPHCLRRPCSSRGIFSSFRTPRKRIICYMAMGYSFGWAIVWVPFLVYRNVIQSYSTTMMLALLAPLQGVCNFLVFMFPKARIAKFSSRMEHVSWGRAFLKACFSE